jgi:hypothetical protein
MKELNVEIACLRLVGVHVIPVTSPEIALEFLKQCDSMFASRPLTMATEYPWIQDDSFCTMDRSMEEDEKGGGFQCNQLQNTSVAT